MKSAIISMIHMSHRLTDSVLDILPNPKCSPISIYTRSLQVAHIYIKPPNSFIKHTENGTHPVSILLIITYHMSLNCSLGLFLIDIQALLSFALVKSCFYYRITTMTVDHYRSTAVKRNQEHLNSCTVIVV